MNACGSRRTDVATVVDFLDRGARLETRSALLETPLIRAACSGSVEVVNALLERGAARNAKGLNTQTALHAAVDRSEPLIRHDIVQSLLRNGAETNAIDGLGNTALHLAAGKGLPDIVQMLIDAGARLNVINTEGQAALHRACRIHPKPGLEVIDRLIRHGAAMDIKDKEGNTPLRHTIHLSNHPLSLFLIAHGSDTQGLQTDRVSEYAGMPALHAAARAGMSSRLVEMLKNGADVDVTHRGMNTAQAALQANQAETMAIIQAWKAQQAIEGVLSNRMEALDKGAAQARP